MGTPLTALLVDDNIAVTRMETAVLQESGFRVSTASSLSTAHEILATHPRGEFDVILLDLDLGDTSGWDLLASLREGGDRTPVLVVSGTGTQADRVAALEGGADDFLVKPIAAAELLARVHAVVRRCKEPRVLVFGDLELPIGSLELVVEGRRIDLSPIEHGVLRALMEARGRPCSREDLLRSVWHQDFDPGTTVVQVQITRLRKKLGPDHPVIQTVLGQGYRLAEPSRPRPPTG